MLDVICFMNLWGFAVLELDSHPDHNKGPDQAPCACPETNPIDSQTTTYNSRQPTIRLYNLCLEVLTVHGNELRL